MSLAANGDGCWKNSKSGFTTTPIQQSHIQLEAQAAQTLPDRSFASPPAIFRWFGFSLLQLFNYLFQPKFSGLNFDHHHTERFGQLAEEAGISYLPEAIFLQQSLSISNKSR
jgi:hypothetical protein